MKFLTEHRTELIFVPLLIALGFSSFIYWEHFQLTSKLLNTLAALGALYGMLFAPKRSLPIAGFWIGILWCYWIGFSFQYYGFSWAMGLIAVAFGIVYAIFFGLIAISSHPLIRALILFTLTYIWPMDFNWVQPELIFVESYIGIHKWQFALVLLSLSLTYWFQRYSKLIPLLILLATFQHEYPHPPLPDIKIKLISTNIPQDLKWQASQLDATIRHNLLAIDEAAQQGYQLVILPEAAFTLYMNHNPDLVKFLQELSYRIPILTGTLYQQNGKNYNVSYLFNGKNITIAKKTILVPFGEYIPLPEFMRGWVNRTIFGGGSDFVTADKPTDFEIHGISFRNAICYEATREELYTPDTDFILAISNNGWFKPSIEPTLQNLLIRFYARKNGTVVYHSANGGGTGIIF